MTSGNPPEQSRGRPATRREAGGVERSTATPKLPGAHEATDLNFIPGPDRFHYWSEISDDVKAYLERKVGPKIDWWADQHKRERDRPYAVVLGPNGLAITTPRVNAQGQRTQSIRLDLFAPSSLKHAVVQQQLIKPRGALRSLVTGRAGAPQPAAPPHLNLSQEMRGFLGNLPLEAQQRLQTPFLGTQPVTHYLSYAYGNDKDYDAWCYLAGPQTLTFASGHCTRRPGTPARQATWHLTCYQADIAH
ncbi:hypothetical protein [Kribbella sp. NPDC000426]|uniref:hypothetical protein n=1 Tax=Kribbella sp. NPDC000426 TaxID=3154255 RepID=UPI00331B1EFC